MKLVIVESPSKAKTIEKYLGSGFKVTASGGHVCDLPEKKLGIDIDHDFEPEYVVNPDKKATIDKMKNDLKKADKVYLATDPDREGEAISWHLKNTLGITDEDVRIVFNEISKKAVNKALESPRKIDLDLVDAQQARRVLDRLVGYKLSPVISKKIKSGLSAGRVQSVALRMVVEREREIRNFKPEEYWNIFAFLFKEGDGNKIFKTSLADKNKKKIKVHNKEEHDAIMASLKNASFCVDSVKRAVSKSKPSAPFTTSTMQQDASAKYSMSAPQVMQIAQKLYEGVEVEGEGQIALVTYIRTDSVRVSDDAKAEAKAFIIQKYGEAYVPAKYNEYTAKKGAQDAHEAIRPISLERTPESLKNKMQSNMYKLYKLIYDRFVASQMTEAQYNTLTVRVAANCSDGEEYGFSLKGKTLLFDGYTVVYTAASTAQSEEEEQNILPDLKEGEPLLCKEIKSEQKFTKPPARYSDASLVKAMEENGIGRPSTYASIIGVLGKRLYIEKEGKYFKPTELGEVVNDTMVKFFPAIMDYKFTAKMENKLDEIEEGHVAWKQVIKDFYPDFYKSIIEANANGEKYRLPVQESDVICEKCGAKMVIRDGRYGKFLACPNFPTCKNVKSIVQKVADCPLCKKAIVKKRSKTGKYFYGCEGYPECKFVSWEIPAPYLCPECGSIMKMNQKEGITSYICMGKECKHIEKHETIQESGETNES